MQYLLLIYDNEAQMADRSPEKNGAIFAGYKKFTQDIIASGAFKAGEALQPTGTATSVRVRGGQRLVTDGPFAETREQLGGFYMIEAPDLDVAIDIAAQIPTAREGTIEVRPIMVWDTPES